MHQKYHTNRFSSKTSLVASKRWNDGPSFLSGYSKKKMILWDVGPRANHVILLRQGAILGHAGPILCGVVPGWVPLCETVNAWGGGKYQRKYRVKEERQKKVVFHQQST